MINARFTRLGHSAVSVLFASAVVIAGPALADDDDEDEIPFAEGQVLLQLNDTDGDLGFHARIDGDAWKNVTIESPSERKLLSIRLRGKLRRQGLTELAFESAEPTFDELLPEVFFGRFPEGEYEIEGRGLDGSELSSISVLSHVIPAAPANLRVSTVPASDDCESNVPVVSEPVVIAWDPVTSSHATLGRAGDVEIDSYEVAIEGENVDYTVNVEGDVTVIALAAGALPSGVDIKYQVLVREAEGNESSAESCFNIM